MNKGLRAQLKNMAPIRPTETKFTVCECGHEILRGTPCPACKGRGGERVSPNVIRIRRLK